MEKIKNLNNLLKNNYDKKSKAVNTITSLVTDSVSKITTHLDSKFRETSESMDDPGFRKQVERSGWRPSSGPKNYTKRKKPMNPNLLNIKRK